MKRLSYLLILACILFPLRTPASMAAAEGKAGHVTGKVTDSQGKPVTDAQVLINGTTNAGQKAEFGTKTDGKGEYAQRVPDGLYRIRAWVRREYNGQKYDLTLHPQDDDMKRTYDSAPGAVKNFTWKLKGLMAYPGQDEEDGSSYYGGHLVFKSGDPSNGNAPLLEFAAGSTVEITLTPDGPLVDGSTGKPVVFKRKYDEKTLNFVAYQKRRIIDIPTGRYTVTARVIDPSGGATTLRVAAQAFEATATPLAASAKLEFTPYKSSTPGILSGVNGSTLYLLK